MSNEGLRRFLTRIWGTEQGTVFLASKQTQGGLWRVGSPQVWPDNADNIVKAIVLTNAQKDPYYGPGIYPEGTLTKEKENAWRAKCFWVDIDGYKDKQSAPETALKLLQEAGLPLPTMQLQTSKINAQHWYWELEDYVPAAVVNDINRRLAYFLGGDTACWDISHVMRPPFTHNHKPEHMEDGISPPVTIVEDRETQYTPGMFTALPQVREQIVDELELGEIPDIKTVMMKYPWDTEHTELFNQDATHFWDEGGQDYRNRGMAMVRLAYFCAEIGMNDEAIYAVLLDVDERWGKFRDRKDRHKQLAVIVQKARTKYPAALITQIQEKPGQELKPVYGFHEFLKTEYKFDWIYEEFIPEQTINFITARPGLGKSRFMIQMAASLALGRDFLRWKLRGGARKVLFMSLEMGPPVVKEFLLKLCAAENYSAEDIAMLDEMFKIVPAGEAFPLTTPQGEGFMEMVFSEYQPEVVFIDAMGSLTYEDLTEKQSKDIMGVLKRYLNKYNVTFYIVHHNRKETQQNANKPPTRDDFYGNTYGATDAASIKALWKNPQGHKDHLELHDLKNRLGAEETPLVLNSRAAFTYSIVKEEDIVYSDPPKRGRPGKEPSADKDETPGKDNPPSERNFGFGNF